MTLKPRKLEALKVKEKPKPQPKPLAIVRTGWTIEEEIQTRTVAKMYFDLAKRSGLSFDDIAQEARMAIIKERHLWEPKKGQSYKTFIFARAKWALLDYILKQNGFNQDYLDHQEVRRKALAIYDSIYSGQKIDLKKFAKRILKEYNRIKSKEDAEKLRNKIKFIDLLLSRGNNVLSLDTNLKDENGDDSGNTLGDVLPSKYISPYSNVELESLRKALRKFYFVLTPKEQQVLRLRYMQEKTQDECRPYMNNISRARVSELERNAINKLREAMQRYKPDFRD
jgi:RNA polymerase sigma factor (sigma-70 family)